MRPNFKNVVKTFGFDVRFRKPSSSIIQYPPPIIIYPTSWQQLRTARIWVVWCLVGQGDMQQTQKNKKYVKNSTEVYESTKVLSRYENMKSINGAKF